MRKQEIENRGRTFQASHVHRLGRPTRSHHYRRRIRSQLTAKETNAKFVKQGAARDEIA
jgi:hypothetical protein